MSKYDTFLFRKDLDELGIELTEIQISQFLLYYEMLVEWNKVMNLTAITDYDEVMKKHFIDSLAIINAYPLDRDNMVIDVGTGAGFPGLPLKIAYPHLKITLLDSLSKRIQFLDQIIQKLKLTDIKTLHGRAEDYARMGEYREKYDLCVSRAVANLSTLSEYCLPYVKPGGVFISYKGEKKEEEMKAARKAIEILGGELKPDFTFKLPDTDIMRTLIPVKKIFETSKKYPRKAGLPLKKPLI